MSDPEKTWVVGFVDREYYTVTVQASTYEEACERANDQARERGADPGSVTSECELLEAKVKEDS